MSETRRHVMFSPSAAGALKHALKLAGRADEVLCPLDDFSFGPIATDDGEARIRWVEDVLGYSGWQEITDRSAAFLAAFDRSAAPVTAWISWDVTKIYAGFLWWLSNVDEFPISIVEAPALPMMSSRQMLRIHDKTSPLSADRRAYHLQQWRQLKIENASLRVIAGTELVSTGLDHFDDILLKHATHEWQKMATIVSGALADSSAAGIYQTGDLLLAARVADLAEAGRLEWRGDLSEMHRGELRLATTSQDDIRF